MFRVETSWVVDCIGVRYDGAVCSVHCKGGQFAAKANRYRQQQCIIATLSLVVLSGQFASPSPGQSASPSPSQWLTKPRPIQQPESRPICKPSPRHLKQLEPRIAPSRREKVWTDHLFFPKVAGVTHPMLGNIFSLGLHLSSVWRMSSSSVASYLTKMGCAKVGYA